MIQEGIPSVEGKKKIEAKIWEDTNKMCKSYLKKNKECF